MDFLETSCKQEISPIKRGYFFQKKIKRRKKNQAQHILALEEKPSCHTSSHTPLPALPPAPPKWCDSIDIFMTGEQKKSR